MSTIIDSFYNEHQELSVFLAENKEYSLKSTSDSGFSKVLVLAAASYFETKIMDVLSNYSSHQLSGDEKLFKLLKSKAFDRQYHTLFDWKAKNANRFFANFGDAAKAEYSAAITEREELKEGARAFMTLGSMRNVLVHSNFASTPIEETYEEIYNMFKKALVFIRYIEQEFFLVVKTNRT